MNEHDIMVWLNGYTEGILFTTSKLTQQLSQGKTASSQEIVKEEPKQKESKPKAEKPKTETKSRIDKGKVIALHNAGWGAKKIQEEMKCSDATVYNILKEYREANEGK